MLEFRTVWDCVTALHVDIKYTVVATASAVHAGLSMYALCHFSNLLRI